MKRWLWRGVILGGILGVAGFLVAASGLIPTKASSGHWPMTEWFLRFAMKRSIATHSLAVKVPDNLDDPALVLMGAGHYEIGCRSCHGEPGRPKPPIAAAMLPVPPDLVPRIRESNAKKLFYVVKHGMKFTGMPAWPAPQRDDEVWAMVAFLLKYPELDAAAYQRLVQREPGGETSPTPEVAPSLKRVVQSCTPCHGHDGLGREGGEFPRLAGQRAGYLRQALAAYAGGKRHSGTMQVVSAALSREMMGEVADHYERLGARTEAKRASGSRSDVTALARGEEIARNGIRAQRVPACLECHAPGGKRGRPEYPLLHGQPADYLELQLMLFKEERRGGSAFAHLMRPVASRLTPEQMRDVARYFESLDAP